ncbi:hypothetical protein CIB95_11200 [Lottiidibacillus patelloidae]|uniref:Uncharacterized protein n=1 Tax=Lottiidibacillus patelloidae TaxID=2670334 RepID=A0A263BTW7_9BACI|nr:hypothetical protein [Lottiidibacillus patelloidae]OZM56777.1 hypothetical protein CIB95_11200 [Lottiidibacillus patelloidae]
MFKQRLLQSMKYIIGVALLITGIFSYLYYQEVKEEQRQWKRFVNHFYHSIDRSLGRIDTIIAEQPKAEQLEQRIALLEKELYTAETTLANGHYFLDGAIYYSYDLFDPFTSFLFGTKTSVNGIVRLELPPMSEDQLLDEDELALLKALRDILKETKDAMYSPDTKQENPELTVEEFNEIITTHLDKDKLQLYKDTLE